MYRSDTLAWTPASRGLATDVLVSAMASVILALAVLLSGQLIGEPELSSTIPPAILSASVSLEVDPRDGVVANGSVTPWMERMNTPDLALAP